MSRTRHDEIHPLRWFGLGFAGAALTPPAPPGWDRLITTQTGAALARAPHLLATVAPDRALLVAPETPVALHASRRVELRILYLPPATPRTARAVAVTPLLHALIERLVARGTFDRRDAGDARLIGVVLDEVAALAEVPHALALPSDPRARRAAEHALANPDAPLPAALLAQRAGVSPRTLERVFAAQLGCGVAAWQRRLRLVVAERTLCAGGSVTDAAFDAGYASPSAFIAAFRGAFGTTPGRRARRVSR
ncbi:MAG TPA: AraC family transcriptional regulator [Candidatus Sulfotelmatobacter sp.]|nr:AraC family transcriptional regulator [Candidatus Sulfotelmatobacter sp.]